MAALGAHHDSIYLEVGISLMDSISIDPLTKAQWAARAAAAKKEADEKAAAAKKEAAEKAIKECAVY